MGSSERTLILFASVFYLASIYLASKGMGWRESIRAAVSSIETVRRDKASKPLALAGLHPYNPLTGIM
jgi:hypothetical protein